ncbi:helicase associated domain-containing protein [Agromyces sp. G08B096]|uniref:Helicase associated domain-containing protein n=1 Tax=Agromyces sp. G08B096 TaxID=3156399 RepID=A0AAU7W9W0_9MICO
MTGAGSVEEVGAVTRVANAEWRVPEGAGAWGAGLYAVETEADWFARADAFAAFAREHGRLPGTGAGADAEERRLARWVKYQREAAHRGRLPRARAEWLDAEVPSWRRPADHAWRAAAVRVGLYVAEHGAYPSSTSADVEVRRLGTWLRTQRRAHDAGRLSDDRRTWLDLNLPYWRSPSAESWYLVAESLARFRTEQRRLPRSSGDASERRLARWLRDQRAAAAAGRLEAEQSAWLEQAIPGWADARLAAWMELADAVAGFARSWGRLPARDGGPGEQRLARWLAAQRAAAARGTLSQASHAALDERVPGWLDPSGPAEERWRDRLEETAAFLQAHGRLPARSAAAAEGERRLAVWLAGQRSAARAGRLLPNRRADLDRLLPGWASTEEDAWRSRARAAAAFIIRHGHPPTVRSPEPGARTLAVWLGRQRSLEAAGLLPESRRTWLSRHLPGWHDHHLATWRATAERLLDFRAEHGRLPTRAAGTSELERELGVWLANQRAAQRTGRLAADRCAWLDEHVPEWRDSRLAAWLAQAIEVERFTSAAGRLPSPRSTSPRARALGTWLDAQRTARRRGELQPNRIAWLDAHLPGWSGRIRPPGSRTRAAAPWPGVGLAPEARAHADRVLREWIDRARRRDGLPMRSHHRRWLDDNMPGWDRRGA